MARAPKVTRRVVLLYGIGAISFGVFNNGFSYFLLFYYNQVLGLPGSYAGAAILISMIFDALSDPLVGIWSDNVRSRWGRRHPFMYASAFPVAFVYFCIWYPPELSDFGLFIYVTIAAILARLFITLYEIPSVSLGVELTDDYDARTRLLGVRMSMGWYGGLIMAILMWGIFIERWGELNPSTYQLSGAIGAVAIFLAIVWSSVGLRRFIPYLNVPPERESYAIGQLVRDLKVTLANRSYAALFFAALFAAVGGGIKANFDTYINLHFWEFTPTQVQWILVAMLLSATLAALLMPKISGRYDKKAAAIAVYAVATTFAALPYILRLIGLFPDNDSPLLYPIMLVHQTLDVTLVIMSGIIVSSMLADVVEHRAIQTGRREEGLIFATQTFAAKASSGVGVFFTGIVLDVINFPTAAVPGDVADEIIWDLGFVFGPSIMIIYFIALGSICFYDITRRGHNGRVTELRNREMQVTMSRVPADNDQEVL